MTNTHNDMHTYGWRPLLPPSVPGGAGRRRRWARFSPPFNSSVLYENVRGSEQGALFHPLRPFINRHPLYSTHNALHCSSRPRAHGCGSAQNLGQSNQESRCPRTLVCIIYTGWHERNASIFIRQLHGVREQKKQNKRERVRENALKNNKGSSEVIVKHIMFNKRLYSHQNSFFAFRLAWTQKTDFTTKL